MSFSLIRSNKVEQLKDHLASLIQQQPLHSPLQAETVIIPSIAMQRWLGLQLSTPLGINCHQDFTLPASWIWTLVAQCLPHAPKQDLLARERMTWMIFSMLDNYLTQDAFKTLQYYLIDDNNQLKRWQLATRIADTFDRYQYYRPDLIRAWSKGEDASWQAELWRGLLQQVGDQHHRVALIDQLLRLLKQGKTTSLPERISIFCLPSMPPLLIQVLHAVAEHIDVRLFQLTPSSQYWADLVSNKEHTHQLLQHLDEDVLYETGHELLTSWGKQGQAFQNLLLDNEFPQTLEYDAYCEDWPNTLLGQLQQNIFRLEQTPRSLQYDESLQLHSCHSPMREVQILHDSLLHLFNTNSSVQAEDVLVMIPDISRYAPYIEAIFSNDEARPYIPWNLSDISVVDEHPIIRIFFQLLKLPQSRFTFSELSSYLDVPEICNHFGLSDDQQTTVLTLLKEVRVRWGVDGEHRESFNLPSWNEQTWQQAEQRIFSSYAMDKGHHWQNISTLNVDSSTASTLAKFWSLFDRLNHWRIALQGSHSAQQWQQLLLSMLTELFGTQEDQEGRLQLIRHALDEFSLQASDVHMSLPLVQQCLLQSLEARESRGRYFSGGVSFCGMRPMRSLPFRVIALLGMQDSNFPRREQALEFDSMNEHWRAGDPKKSDEDRYLFLETLLCTRELLYISYCGHNSHNNNKLQPSVIVRELLDVLDQSERRVSKEHVAMSTRITQHHPMQAFSPTNYLQRKSHDRFWCDISNRMLSSKGNSNPSSNWPNYPLKQQEESDESTIALTRLISFVQHPIKYFFNYTLGIWLSQKDEASDEEVFELSGLERWQLKQFLLNANVQGFEVDSVQMGSEGMLPHGSFSEQTLYSEQRLLQPLHQKINAYQHRENSVVAINISCTLANKHSVTISGQVGNYYLGLGLMHHQPSKLQGKHLLAFWVEHLALCASGIKSNSHLYCIDHHIECETINIDEAKQLLTLYINALHQGEKRPAAFFPKSSWTWSQSKKSNCSKTYSAWNGNEYNNIPGDKDDPYIQLALRHLQLDVISSKDFSLWVESIYSYTIDTLNLNNS